MSERDTLSNMKGDRSHSNRHIGSTKIARPGELPPFLSIDPELSNQIYELVLGGNTLHIGVSKFNPSSTEDAARPLRFAHIVCLINTEETPLDATTKIIHHELCKLGAAVTYESKHRCCLDILDAKAWTGQSFDSCGIQITCSESSRAAAHEKNHETKPWHISLALLRVCRQVYHEARLIPYAVNTFDFDIFVSEGLMKRQRKALTHLELSGRVLLRQLESARMLGNLTQIRVGLSGCSALENYKANAVRSGLRASKVKVMTASGYTA